MGAPSCTTVKTWCWDYLACCHVRGYGYDAITECPWASVLLEFHSVRCLGSLICSLDSVLARQGISRNLGGCRVTGRHRSPSGLARPYVSTPFNLFPLCPLDSLSLLPASKPPSQRPPQPFTMAVATPQKEQLSGIALYSRFAFAGACCCSITHGAVTPLDV